MMLFYNSGKCGYTLFQGGQNKGPREEEFKSGHWHENLRPVRELLIRLDEKKINFFTLKVNPPQIINCSLIFQQLPGGEAPRLDVVGDSTTPIDIVLGLLADNPKTCYILFTATRCIYYLPADATDEVSLSRPVPYVSDWSHQDQTDFSSGQERYSPLHRWFLF